MTILRTLQFHWPLATPWLLTFGMGAAIAGEGRLQNPSSEDFEKPEMKLLTKPRA